MQSTKGKIAIVGAGPGGLAAALAAHRVGFEVRLFERANEIKAAGNILNLWPPPQKVLQVLGVDTEDLGAPSHCTFRRNDGHLRADIVLPEEVVATYGGGFIGLLRWGLYKRLIDSLPEGILQLGKEVTSMTDEGAKMRLKFKNDEEYIADVVIGADGLHSIIRKTLWGDQPIRNQYLHLVGGYVLSDTPNDGEGVIGHNRTTQVSYTPIRHDLHYGYEWWVLESFKPGAPAPADLHKWCKARAKGFSKIVTDMIDATPADHLQRWEIRDRPPLLQWSKGRATLVGDAAHPTSPYAAYGAGMSIEDGYFLARELAAIDITDTTATCAALQRYEDRRKPHTIRVTEAAYKTGRLFHHMPAWLRPFRDFIFDHTPLLQRMIGNQMPAHILSQLAEIEDPAPAHP